MLLDVGRHLVDRRRQLADLTMRFRTSARPNGIDENTVISKFGRLISAFAARTTLPFCSTLTARRLPVNAALRFIGTAAVDAVAALAFAIDVADFTSAFFRASSAFFC